MFAAISSVMHGFSLVAGVGALIPVVSQEERAAMISISIVAFVTSCAVGGFSKRAVICRSFHSPAVELFLTTKALSMISVFCRIVLIENKNHPDLERRYDPHSFYGMIAASLYVISICSKEVSILLSILYSIVVLLIVDRIYFVLFNPSFIKKHVINDKEKITKFTKELLTPGWRILPKYVRNTPRLRHSVFTSNDCWYEVITRSMIVSSFTLIDVTEADSSRGLTDEIKMAYYLIKEKEITPLSIMFICKAESLDKVKAHLDKEIGVGLVDPFPVGKPGNEDKEMTAIFARAQYACAQKS